MGSYQIQKLHTELTEEAWSAVYARRQEYAGRKGESVDYANWETFRDQYLTYLRRGIGIFVLWQEERVFGYLNLIVKEKSEVTYLLLRYDLLSSFIDEALLEVMLVNAVQFCPAASYLVLNSTDRSNDYLEKLIPVEISETRELFELPIARLNREVLADWNEQFQQQRQEFKMTLVHELPAELVDEFCDIAFALDDDVVDKSRLLKSVRLTPEQLLGRQASYQKSGIVQFLFLIFSKQEKKLIGYTDVTLKRDRPRIATQNMTGVLATYRGQGLGKLLKARMLKELLEQFPTLELVRTGIHPGNTRSQNLNRKMGFQKVGEYKEYILRKEDILTILSGELNGKKEKS